MSPKILKFPDPFLRQKAEPVRKVNQKVKDLLEAMWKTMEANSGVGLAAIQVGRTERVFIAGHGPYQIEIINPKIVKKSGHEIMAEGCLSLPGIFLPIERFYQVTVEGINRQGKKVVFKEEGLLARAFQQEMDHLDGILIIDRVDPEVLKQTLDDLEKNPPKEQNIKADQSLINAIRKEKGI